MERDDVAILVSGAKGSVVVVGSSLIISEEDGKESGDVWISVAVVILSPEVIIVSEPKVVEANISIPVVVRSCSIELADAILAVAPS